MDMKPEIPDFYAGKTILVTGCTGFIGKVLVWKLLRSCPEIEKIYILLRPKKGKTILERKNSLLRVPIFNILKSENPKVLDKVEAVFGDIAEENLGLSIFDKEKLVKDVSIVFYGAAILKMDATLKVAINVNTKGVIRCLDLASEMNKLMAFIYISTAYCCSELSKVEEKLYSINMKPHQLIQAIDCLPNTVLEKVTTDIIAPLPNTYTFSKRLAELMLMDYERKVPLIVARPTIVMPSVDEPFPGWLDSLNGPVGLSFAVAAGVLHSIYIDIENKADLVPVDRVCNKLIAIPWAENKKNRISTEIVVYNLALVEKEQIPWHEFEDWGRNAAVKYPLKNILWYPSYHPVTSNFVKHKIQIFLYQWVPAYVVDFLLKLFGQKTFLVGVQQKITQGADLLSYFGSKAWIFETENVQQMKLMMNEADLNIFPVTENGLDGQLVSDNTMLCAKRYIFHEEYEDPTENQMKLNMFYALKMIVKVVIYYFIFRLLLFFINIVSDT